MTCSDLTYSGCNQGWQGSVLIENCGDSTENEMSMIFLLLSECIMPAVCAVIDQHPVDVMTPHIWRYEFREVLPPIPKPPLMLPPGRGEDWDWTYHLGYDYNAGIERYSKKLLDRWEKCDHPTEFVHSQTGICASCGANTYAPRGA